MERAPALFPAGLDRRRYGRRKGLADAPLSGVVRVRDELEGVPDLHLLEPLRDEREEAGTCDLGLVCRDVFSGPTGLRQVFVKDPDGNMVEFIGPSKKTGARVMEATGTYR